jgi:hypothetical protein
VKNLTAYNPIIRVFKAEKKLPVQQAEQVLPISKPQEADPEPTWQERRRMVRSIPAPEARGN